MHLEGMPHSNAPCMGRLAETGTEWGAPRRLTMVLLEGLPSRHLQNPKEMREAAVWVSYSFVDVREQG